MTLLALAVAAFCALLSCSPFRMQLANGLKEHSRPSPSLSLPDEASPWQRGRYIKILAIDLKYLVCFTRPKHTLPYAYIVRDA